MASHTAKTKLLNESQRSFQKVVDFQSHKYLLIGSALKILAVVQFYLTAVSFWIRVIGTLSASFFSWLAFEAVLLWVFEWPPGKMFVC